MKTLSIEDAKDWVKHGWSSDVNLDQITHLAPGTAAILATKDGDVSLRKLQHLDEESASALSIHKKGSLDLFGLKVLSEKAALSLSKHHGELTFWHVQTSSVGIQALKGHPCFKEDEYNYQNWFMTLCTQEMAKKFAEDPNEADLGEFQGFEPGAAAIYAKAKCDSLDYLGNIEFLSEEDAKALATFPGKILFGQCFSTMSAEIMQALGKHRGGLRLGIDSVEGNVLNYFRDSGDLDLWCVRSFEAKDLEALRNRKGNLSLGSINEIDDATADILSSVEGDLDLENLVRLNNSGFSLLGKHKGLLRIGVYIIDKEKASLLIHHQGPIEFTNLKFILPDAAQILSTFSSNTEIVMLSLNRVTMPFASIEALKKHADYDSEWVGNGILDKDIAELKNKPDLGPQRLLGEGAEIVLMKAQENEDDKNLYLDSILAISDLAAENISKFRGTIDLGVYELTDSAAVALSKHRGTLSLRFLHKISKEGAKALSLHKDLHVSEHYLSPELYRIVTKAESSNGSSSESEQDVDDSESTSKDDEKTPEKLTQSIHFNLGRFRARYDAAGSRMGGFKDLLDEIEEAVKAGADLSFLKTEQLIVDFLVACQKGEDTSEIRKRIDDSFWEE
jgi:hypothetical protein